MLRVDLFFSLTTRAGALDPGKHAPAVCCEQLPRFWVSCSSLALPWLPIVSLFDGKPGCSIRARFTTR
jgi:hypothetical protein